MDDIELIIKNGQTIYYPVVEEGITWETERKGYPGKLIFKVLKDDILKFEEGNPVRMKFGETNVFYGFNFTNKQDKDGLIQVTVYDQLRYFKNKDSYIYINKKASDFIKILIDDFNLSAGEIQDTEFLIQKRNEDNKTLFDMAQNALDLTLQNKKKMYVLYDDFGKLTLKDIESMKLNLLIDSECAENYSYTTSIDRNTYNQIKLAYDNKDTGKREVYISKDTGNINKWGVLQYFDKIEENTNGQAKADALLSLYNKKTKNLTINNVLGDIRVRAGTSIVVKLNLGDVNIMTYMLVEKAKHTFKNGEHLMNLTLRGNDFIA